MLIQADEEKRNDLIAQKKTKLSSTSVVWDELRLEMLQRCSNCYTKLLNLIDEKKISITERLQYEASHTGTPEKWWKEDYPYRLKIEILNMSSGVENFVTKTITEDIRWLNTSLNNQFKTHILFEQNNIADDVKNPFESIQVEKNLNFENIGKKRTIAKVGTAALTIAGYAVFPVLGLSSLFVSQVVGTGSSIISEKVFNGKVEKQRSMLKEVIAKHVPEVINNATAQTEERLNTKYDEIIKSAREKEDSWIAAQYEAIENSVKLANPQGKETLERNIADFKNIYKKIQNT